MCVCRWSRRHVPLTVVDTVSAAAEDCRASAETHVVRFRRVRLLRARAATAVGLSMLAASLTAVSGAQAAAAPRLDVYVGDLSRSQIAKLVELGVDRHELKFSRSKDGGKDSARVEVILSGTQARQARGGGRRARGQGDRRPDRRAARDAAGGRRVRGLEAVRRDQGRLREDGQEVLADREVRQPRQDRPRQGHRRHEDHARRAAHARRVQADRRSTSARSTRASGSRRR